MPVRGQTMVASDWPVECYETTHKSLNRWLDLNSYLWH